jgi:hypothetical protein
VREPEKDNRADAPKAGQDPYLDCHLGGVYRRPCFDLRGSGYGIATGDLTQPDRRLRVSHRLLGCRRSINIAFRPNLFVESPELVQGGLSANDVTMPLHRSWPQLAYRPCASIP